MDFNLFNTRTWTVPLSDGTPADVYEVRDGKGAVVWRKYYRVSYDSNVERYWIVRFSPNGDGVAGDMPDVYVDQTSSVALPPCAFSREGYDLASPPYNAEDDGSGEAYSPGQDVRPSADMMLYAQWEAHPHTLSFLPCGGSGSMPRIETAYGEEVALPSCSFEPPSEEYHFSRWLAKIGSAVYEYQDMQTVAVPDQDVELSAAWSNLREIYFYHGGDEFQVALSGDVVLSTDGTTEVSVTLTADTRMTESILDVLSGTAVPSCDVRGEMPAVQEVAGWTTTLPANAYARDGYQFKEWMYEDKDTGLTSSYGDGGTLVVPDCDMELTAIWYASTRTVSLDMQGGAGGTERTNVYYGEPLPEIDVPSYDGHKFDGYYTEKNGGGVKYYGEDGVGTRNWDGDGVYVLYANWVGDPIKVTFNSNWDQYTATFDANGGEGGAEYRLDEGAAVVPPAVSRENYEFSGWSPAAPAAMPAEDLTCTAQWTPMAMFATITVAENKATCAAVEPEDATVQYSTTSASSGFKNGKTFTLQFGNKTETRYGWFRLSRDGMPNVVYKVKIKKTVKYQYDWSEWSSWAGPFNAQQVIIWRNLKENEYGEGNVDFEVIGAGKVLYVRERHYEATGSTVTWSHSVTQV